MSNENPTPLPALPAGVDRLSDLGTLLTLKEAGELLGLASKTIRRMIDRGELLGAHQVPMPGGKGTQWVVPYSELIKSENKTKAEKAPDTVAVELAELREQVRTLQATADLQRALADERGHQLEQLHTTFRLMLTAGETSKKRWWKKP